MFHCCKFVLFIFFFSETTELVTEPGSTIQLEMSGYDTTAPGNDGTENSVLSNEGTSVIPSVEIVTLSITTEKPVEVTAFKPEENTISVPPLASFKNITAEEDSSNLSIYTVSEYPKNITSIESSPLNNSDSLFLPKHALQQNSVSDEENKNNTTSTILTTIAITRPKDTTMSNFDKENVEITPTNITNLFNKTVQEVDPIINTINEKKHDDQISTSTVISAVNSTVTVHITPPVLTITSSNLTNLIDVDQNLSGNEFEFAKNLPLSIETTTFSNIGSNSSTHFGISEQDSPLNEPNQTNNDIKVIAKSNKEILLPSGATIETPSTHRSNEIKPEPDNTIKNTNITEFQIESFHNYVQELPETTQSNDIQVQDQIKQVNKSLTQKVLSQNSSDGQKQPSTTTSVTSIKPSSHPTVVPTVNPGLTSVAVGIEDIQNNYTTINNYNTLPINENTDANETTTENLISFTTTPLPTTSVIPSTMLDSTITITSTPPSENTIHSFSSSTVSPATPTANLTSTASSTTTKSNLINDQETATELQLPPEANTTNLDGDSKNYIKNDTSLVFRDNEDDDDEALSYNNTDISDKRGSSDTINNNENDDDSDDLLETAVNGSLSTVFINPKRTTTPVPVTYSSSLKPTTSISDEATQIDEDRSSM